MSVVTIGGYTLYSLVDARIELKKRKSVIDNIGFGIDQQRNITRTRPKSEDPVVTEKRRELRKAHKALEKTQVGQGDYELKPVPKPSMWYK